MARTRRGSHVSRGSPARLVRPDGSPRKTFEHAKAPAAEHTCSPEEKTQRDLSCLTLEGVELRVAQGIVPGMHVPGRVYVSEALAEQLRSELAHWHATGTRGFIPALHQIGNAASLPGIVGASIGLPDIHTGYGFAIGHVAAFDMDDPAAVVTPGGVGFDINCGVRMLRSSLTLADVLPLKERLADELYARIPVGVGGVAAADDPLLGTTHTERLASLRDIMARGMAWAVDHGVAWPEDEELCEERGCVRSAAGAAVSQRAEARGIPQLGTLGSGNHYCEVQHVTHIYDAEAAAAMGIGSVGQVCVMVHCGSRGLGHQVAKDALEDVEGAMERDGLGALNDPMLACARIASPEGQRYLAQMAAASNFAYVNRAAIAASVRSAFAETFGRDARALDMHMVYDVAHNIAKEERHIVDGREMRLLVHRKGSTRAFGPGHADLPAAYRAIGQPVLVGGSMGTCSYVLAGTAAGMERTFGSTCHGAGRAVGRHEMRRRLDSGAVLAALAEKGIVVRVGSPDSIAEEAPESYKDVSEVVEVCEAAGISRRVARLEPLIVIKG